MPLMGSLYIGASGLATSQNALNTTANNLSNVGTEGYTRQQVEQGTKKYNTLAVAPRAVANQQTGLGVEYSRVKQIRDFFLDRTYREELGRQSFYRVTADGLGEVESLLGEMNGRQFATALSDLWTSIQELAKEPASTVTQGMLVQRSAEFIARARAVYDGLNAYQDNLNQQIAQEVDKINAYGKRLLDINHRISAVEAGGVERANDLRDTRNLLLDELSALCQIQYGEDILGNVFVRIEGEDFVKGDTCYELGAKVDETTGFYHIFWPQNATYILPEEGNRIYNVEGAGVFRLDQSISAQMGNDMGGLKAMLLARGDHRADYTDLSEEQYKGVSQSVVMNIQAQFDGLIHHVTRAVNDILAQAAGEIRGDLVLEDGTRLSDVSYCIHDEAGYMRDSLGRPLQMFTKLTSPGYTRARTQDGREVWVREEENGEKTETLYSTPNLWVNQELLQRPSLLGLRKADGREDQETADALKEAFSREIYTLNPHVLKQTSLSGYYSDMVAHIGGSGSVFRSIYENQASTVESARAAREQVTGVSSDEELANMIRYQNGFNASSRYINVISQMLEHLVSTLGR